MSSFKPRRPSPAFVLAAIALFAALGGTGYAATRPGAESASASKKATKPLTKAQTEKLIAKYVKAHKSELQGPAGKNGAPGGTGSEGKQGPQGPGAIPVRMESVGVSGPQQVASFGPWSVTLTCGPSAPNANVVVHGPGTVMSTASIAHEGGTATTFVSQVETADGWSAAVNTDNQLSARDLLQSGSTMYELTYQVTATNGGLFEVCNLSGDAIPVS